MSESPCSYIVGSLSQRHRASTKTLEDDRPNRRDKFGLLQMNMCQISRQMLHNVIDERSGGKSSDHHRRQFCWPERHVKIQTGFVRTRVCNDAPLVLQDGVWNVIYCETLLGRFDQRTRTITGAPFLHKDC